MITSDELLTKVYEAIKDDVANIIDGSVYQDGCRPYNSIGSEDAVLTVSTLSADQVQEGVIALNIFVPNINNATGLYVPNRARLLALSQRMGDIVDALQSKMPEAEIRPYTATQTMANDNGREYIVNQLIRIKLLNNGSK